MKLLIADRDRDLLSCYRQLLEADGYEVRTAFDGTQVLAETAAGGFFLVLMSSKMPRIDSVELTRHLNAEGLPVVLLSTDRERDAERFRDLRLAWLLPFPFEPEELRKVIRSLSPTETEEENA